MSDVEAIFRNLPREHVEAAESRINQLSDDSAEKLQRAESQLRSSYSERGLDQSTMFISDTMHLRKERAETLYKKVLSEYLPLFFEHSEADIPAFKAYCIANTALDTTMLPEIVGLPHVGASIGMSYKDRFDIFVKNEFEHTFKQMRSDVRRSAERQWNELRKEVLLTLMLGSLLGGVFGALAQYALDKLTEEPKNTAPTVTTNGNVK